ncbi:hypothetical protein LCGC14_2213360, partial [marine sediment metagenome]
DSTAVANESVTITADKEADDNSTLLSSAGYIVDSESVVNATAPFAALNRGVDYFMTTTDSAEGSLTARGNITLINTSFSNGTLGFNDTALFVSYSRNIESSAQSTKAVIDNTVLDSFELGVIVLIVLAAVVILAVLFRLGT